MEWRAPENSALTATLGDAFVRAAQHRADAPVREAARVYETSHDVVGARRSIELAVDAAPDDPSLRIAAAWLALEEGATQRANEHLSAGLRLREIPVVGNRC